MKLRYEKNKAKVTYEEGRHTFKSLIISATSAVPPDLHIVWSFPAVIPSLANLVTQCPPALVGSYDNDKIVSSSHLIVSFCQGIQPGNLFHRLM